MNITSYIRELNRQFSAGFATEHTHRPTLKMLLDAAAPRMLVTNEPKQIACGAPDFVLTRDNIPLGYIEAKDIGADLDEQKHKAQLDRYIESLDNLIFTNYTEFRLFRHGEQVSTTHIAEVGNDRIKTLSSNLNAFMDLLQTFIDYEGYTITTAADLAKRMAVKARMLAQVITDALEQDHATGVDSGEMASMLQEQLEAFRKHLITDITPPSFADIYAQTVAYGMFAARLHDPTPETFTREEAAKLIPASDPFLRKFFQHIAGFDLDERIRWIVDDLADIFRATDVGELMKDYGQATQQNDPFIHFYETFLGKYSSRLRKSRGVYYTPEPVVNFIVQAVDDILQGDFGLVQGLADTSKIPVEIEPPPYAPKSGKAKMEKYEKEMHRVQILDPATGTGTFLAAIVYRIYNKYFVKQKGIWPNYVREHLIPRLNGFEVLMAPYAMAHTKLEMVLRKTDFEHTDRLRIFLTNSLEEHHPDTGSLFAQWLSIEAREANTIKRDTPVMVAIGNPPYSGESENRGKWIINLLKDYKQEPGGGALQEKNSKWINDDYVKFIRFGQHYIDRTGEGVLAYINNHSFLDNPTFRGMRWSLLQSFDKIYIIDMHGNSKKKEVAPDGSPDQNVFEIQQGVSINLFIKTDEKQQNVPGKLLHYDLYGNRNSKYRFLQENNLERINFKELTPQAPQYYFVPKDYSLQADYGKGFLINDLFSVKSVGIVTARDDFTIHYTSRDLRTKIARFREMDDETARVQFLLGRDVHDWKVAWARKDLEDNVFDSDNDTSTPIYYRPFDIRYTYYTGKSRGFHCRPRKKVMQHLTVDQNVGLVLCRQCKGPEDYSHVFVTNNIFESSLVSNKTSEIGYGFPLYCPPPPKSDKDLADWRSPNMDPDILSTIADGLGLRFTSETEDDEQTFAPIDLLDYIYAVLHAPTYRRKYSEFLKIDFPCVPYPVDKIQFKKLAALGRELRTLHLFESPTLSDLITSYPELGDNQVAKLEYKPTDLGNNLGEVYINQTQYFSNVPVFAWNFHVGSYQPARKWLKDRKGRTLNHDDIIHYQKIIVALTETGRLMREIEKII